MTIQDIRSQLVLHFCDDDTFTMASQDGIYVEKELEDKKVELILAGLNDLVGMGLIKQAGQNFWVLTRPIHEVTQSVALSIPTCLILADTIETFFDGNDLPHAPINPLAISEMHINTILQILNEILNDTTRDKPPAGPGNN